MHDDEVALTINGVELRHWLGLTIETGIDQIADGFSFSADWNPESELLKNTFKPFKYQDAEIKIGNKKILTGTIESINCSWSDSDRIINVQGRSKTGILIDNPLPDETEFNGLTLGQIANKLCSVYGVSVIVESDSEAIAEIKGEYGQTVAAFLQKIAGPRNLILHNNTDGALVISSGEKYANGSPVAKLTEGKSALISMSSSFDGTARFKTYEAACQVSGETVKSKTTDGSISVDRRKYAKVEEADTKSDNTAKRMLSDGYISSVAISGEITGWKKDSGELWSIGDIVNVTSPSAMLYKEKPWLINKLSMKMEVPSGYTTSFELVPPEIYTGKLPEEYAWN